MGEINLGASAPKASSGSLGLGGNSSSAQVAPSMFFMGCLGPFLQLLEAADGMDRRSGCPSRQLLGSHSSWASGQVEAQLRQRNKARVFCLFISLLMLCHIHLAGNSRLPPSSQLLPWAPHGLVFPNGTNEPASENARWRCPPAFQGSFQGENLPRLTSLRARSALLGAAPAASEGWRCPEPGDRAMPSFGHCGSEHRPAPRTAAKSFLGSQSQLPNSVPWAARSPKPASPQMGAGEAENITGFSSFRQTSPLRQ